MSGINLKPSQRVGVVGLIAPISQAAGTANSGWLDATTFHNFMAVITSGVLGASATLDAKIQQATDNSGTGAKDVTGKALTQIVKASGDNKIATIDLKQEDLDMQNNFKFFQVSITIGTAASLISGHVLGFDCRYGLATASDLAAVVQNV